MSHCAARCFSLFHGPGSVSLLAAPKQNMFNECYFALLCSAVVWNSFPLTLGEKKLKPHPRYRMTGTIEPKRRVRQSTGTERCPRPPGITIKLYLVVRVPGVCSVGGVLSVLATQWFN